MIYIYIYVFLKSIVFCKISYLFYTEFMRKIGLRKDFARNFLTKTVIILLKYQPKQISSDIHI
jgi:hypothetical protein